MIKHFDLEILSYLQITGFEKQIFKRFPENNFGTKARLELLLKENMLEKTFFKDEVFYKITSLGYKTIVDYNQDFIIERRIWFQKYFLNIILTTIISILVSFITAKFTK